MSDNPNIGKVQTLNDQFFKVQTLIDRLILESPISFPSGRRITYSHYKKSPTIFSLRIFFLQAAC